MSFYFFLYVVTIALFFYTFFFILLKNRNAVGFFFFVSIFCVLIWLIFYLLSFSTTLDKDILLMYSRVMYGCSIVSMYSMILFVFKYPSKEWIKKQDYIFMLIFILILFIVILTPYILVDMVFDNEKKIYYEEAGSLYIIFGVLYLLFLPLFSLITFLKLKSLRLINKLRLKYIFGGFFSFMFLSLVFLVLLPAMGIRLFEKQAILFVIPFIISIWYSTQRYHFIDFKVGIGKFVILLISIISSISLVMLLKIYFSDIIGENLVYFWSYNESFGVTEGIFSILLFLMIHRYLKKKFIGYSTYERFQLKIIKLKNKIPFITDFSDLNFFLSKEFEKNFKIKNALIKVFNAKDKNKEIYNFFSKNILNDLFINDIVFIEENKYKFDIEKVEKEIGEDVHLILPIRNHNMELIGIFSLGKQLFNDNYSTESINNLKDFVSFLEGHLKYLNIYSEINDLNLHLDKKVDEKTIEYNNLVNKQKEFIDVISHEIKGPIASTLLQGECVLDDIKSGDYDDSYLLEEIGSINKELLKTGNLANRLFDISSYDLKKIKLYKENLDFGLLLKGEIDTYIKEYSDIDFIVHIKKGVGYVNIDKVQFVQVIDNLLTNAVKFSNDNDGKISILSYVKNDEIYMVIEDNGIGFREVDISSIFDKYSTGQVSGIGLGMGLHLCKRIVKLHGGKIKASLSQELGGAKFTVRIPIKDRK